MNSGNRRVCDHQDSKAKEVSCKFLEIYYEMQVAFDIEFDIECELENGYIALETWGEEQ